MGNRYKIYNGKRYLNSFSYSGKKAKTNAYLDAKHLKTKGYLVRIEKKDVRMKTGVSSKYKKFIFYTLYIRKNPRIPSSRVLIKKWAKGVKGNK